MLPVRASRCPRSASRFADCGLRIVTVNSHADYALAARADMKDTVYMIFSDSNGFCG